MDSLRSFVRWLEAVDGVEQDLSEKILSPTITADELPGREDSDHASSVLSHLEKHEYAGPEHVSLTLMWHTMMRVGGVHVMDVDDYNADEQYVKVRHRPDVEMPIKNKGDGERLGALSDDICDLLDDWLENKRPDVTGEYGTEPLLASRQGRLQKTTLRMYVYRWTCPWPTVKNVRTTVIQTIARRPSVHRSSSSTTTGVPSAKEWSSEETIWITCS